MTFAEAYAIALQNGKFRKHDEKTKNAQLGKYEAPLTIFLTNDYIREKPIRFTNPAIKIIS